MLCFYNHKCESQILHTRTFKNTAAMRYGLESDSSEYTAHEISIQVPNEDSFFVVPLRSDDEISIDEDDLAEMGMEIDENLEYEDPVVTAARYRVPIPFMNSTFLNSSNHSIEVPVPSGRQLEKSVKKGKGRPKAAKKYYKMTNADRRFIIHSTILDPTRSISSIRHELFHVRLQIKNNRLWASKQTLENIINLQFIFLKKEKVRKRKKLSS